MQTMEIEGITIRFCCNAGVEIANKFKALQIEKRKADNQKCATFSYFPYSPDRFDSNCFGHVTINIIFLVVHARFNHQILMLLILIGCFKTKNYVDWFTLIKIKRSSGQQLKFSW